jgi:hypothetical protein
MANEAPIIRRFLADLKSEKDPQSRNIIGTDGVVR